MNKPRRKELERALDLLQQALEIIETVKDEEQEARDNMPDNLQESERAYQMDENVDNLDSVLELIDEAKDGIDIVIES